MPSFEKIHPVHHSASDMFDLVADVEKYPQFVPLCEALRITSRREKAGMEMLIADMSIGYKSIKETFTSKVMLNKGVREINVQYLDGPFKYLDNRWRFVETSESSCDVVFFIDYEFKNKMLGMVMGAMFETAFRRFTAAFEARADEIYGIEKVS